MPFCQSCGAEVNEKAVVCVKCGVAVNGSNIQTQTQSRLQTGPVSDSDWLVTLLLAIFVGFLGMHRFYTGSIGIGVIQLLTAGGCGIWTLIDLFMIVTGSYRDGQDRPLKKS